MIAPNEPAELEEPCPRCIEHPENRGYCRCRYTSGMRPTAAGQALLDFLTKYLYVDAPATDDSYPPAKIDVQSR